MNAVPPSFALMALIARKKQPQQIPSRDANRSSSLGDEEGGDAVLTSPPRHRRSAGASHRRTGDDASASPSRRRSNQTHSTTADTGRRQGARRSATVEQEMNVVRLDMKKLERQRMAHENAKLGLENLKLALDFGVVTQDEFVAKGRAIMEMELLHEKKQAAVVCKHE